MVKPLSVGSIIKIGDVCFMIVGYLFDRINGKLQSAYLIEKYPVGFMGEKSIAYIPQNFTFEVVFEGYSNREFDEYLETQQTFEDELVKLNPNNIDELLDEVEKKLLGVFAMIDKLLPIGSVVSLSIKKETPFVILGYSPEINGTTFDYSASVLPIGLVMSGSIIGFNKKQIDKVIFEGYKDQKFEILSELLETLSNGS